MAALHGDVVIPTEIWQLREAATVSVPLSTARPAGLTCGFTRKIIL